MSDFYKKPMVTLDISEFMRSARRTRNKHIPEAIVLGISLSAEIARDRVRRKTKALFKLHSDWIPYKVQSIPKTPTQKIAAARALARYGDFNAFVYLRGALNPKDSAAFMADHEFGKKRKPQKKFIAVPAAHLRGYNYKTAKGKIRKRWKPDALLKRYRQLGSTFNDKTTTNKGLVLGPQKRRSPGNAFIIMGKGTPYIARRVTRKEGKGLEFLYKLVDTAKIDPRWNFEPTVKLSVLSTYKSAIAWAMRSVPKRL